jgi:hypothetical protein
MRRGTSRHDRKVLNGVIVSRLVSPGVMHEALQGLVGDARRYTLIIKRSRINWETGQLQSVDLVLRESDDIFSSPELDPRLQRARKVTLFIEYNDGGIAFIDLTSYRSWQKLVETETLNRKILAFNRTLKDQAGTGWLTFSRALGIALFPLALLIASAIIYTSLAPNVHRAKDNSVIYPYWMHVIILAILYSWPVFVLAGIGIVLVILRSGALRIWPEYLTLGSMVQTLIRLRSTIVVPGNINAIVVGIALSIFTAVVTWVVK